MKKIFIATIVFMIGISSCNAETYEKYYKTILENNNIISEEISKLEYDSVSEIDLLTTPVETEYKKMAITNSSNQVQLSVNWKKTPKYKSYDVIAVMSDDVNFLANTLVGVQTAIKSSENEYINYSITTQNTKILSNGIGISMNLVNDAIYYELTLRIKYNGSGNIYGNYRHAQANVSLSQSQNYYLNGGNIIFNNNSINTEYDSIVPVVINV